MGETDATFSVKLNEGYSVSVFCRDSWGTRFWCFAETVAPVHNLHPVAV